MKKSLKYTIIFILTLTIAFLLWGVIYLRNPYENRLMKQGNEWVEKIEQYKSQHGKLPNSMRELGIEVTESGPLYYDKEDSVNYKVSFGTSLGESKIYYSDSKKWEDGLRGMGKSEE